MGPLAHLAEMQQGCGVSGGAGFAPAGWRLAGFGVFLWVWSRGQLQVGPGAEKVTRKLMGSSGG
jgi:hypothetical protein